MTDTEQAQLLKTYFESLSPEIQTRLFIVMFNELQNQELVDCYLEGEDVTDETNPDGEFRVFWAHCGEDLTDGLD